MFITIIAMFRKETYSEILEINYLSEQGLKTKIYYCIILVFLI